MFQGKELQTEFKIAWIHKQVSEIREAFKKENHVGRVTVVSHSNMLVRWQPPGKDWIALNIDASFKKPGKVGGGIVARDYRGNWIAGAMIRCFAHNAIEAKCRIITRAISWAWNKGWRKVMFSTDLDSMVNWIAGSEVPSGYLKGMVHTCREMLRMNWETLLKHTYREQNETADRLAKLAHTVGHIWEEFEEPPDNICSALQRDKSGVPRLRRITTHV